MTIRKISWLVSIITISLSIQWYIQRNHFWFYPAVVGIWLFFDNLSHSQKNKTTLDLVIKREYNKFIPLYLGLMILGFFIELIGVKIFKFWVYPAYTIQIWLTLPLMYPFILMSFKETYCLIYSLCKEKLFSVLLSMVIGYIIWEIPNLYSDDWVYTIPYFIVFIGWYILIVAPLYVYKLLNLENYFFNK